MSNLCPKRMKWLFRDFRFKHFSEEDAPGHVYEVSSIRLLSALFNILPAALKPFRRPCPTKQRILKPRRRIATRSWYFKTYTECIDSSNMIMIIQLTNHWSFSVTDYTELYYLLSLDYLLFLLYTQGLDMRYSAI
jgi:hypothetical protein